MDNDNQNSLEGFSTVPTQSRIFWNSRKRSAPLNPNKENSNQEQLSTIENEEALSLSERRKALFEPLEPTNARNRPSDEAPPPDFDTACYPKGWLVGKKRRLVNVDVVESMRRIAVQEMNRKDLEINGLNEQLEEDARILEHLQLQLLQERSKRADVERDNSVLQNQVSMLMNMLHDDEEVNENGGDNSLS